VCVCVCNVRGILSMMVTEVVWITSYSSAEFFCNDISI